MEEALELIVSGYGKKWNGEGAHKRLGKRPLESAASLIQDYDLPCTPQELYSQILDFMKNRHANSSNPSFFFFYSQLFFALLPQKPVFFSCSIGFFPVGITCWNEYCWLAAALRERTLSIWWWMTDWLTNLEEEEDEEEAIIIRPWLLVVETLMDGGIGVLLGGLKHELYQVPIGLWHTYTVMVSHLQ